MTHPPISPLPGANASSAAVDDPNGNKDSLSAAAQVSLANLPSPGKGDVGKDVEQAIHLKPQELELPAPALEKSTRSAALWMGINILATIGIVFINKALFSDSRLKHAQITFAAFHFVITWLALFILSRPYVGMFTSRRGPIVQLTPLAIAMSLNVILTNLSLAYSTVTFYQVARILLKPTVASMNLFLYRSTLPRNAIYALVPACIGVGIVSYYDSRPSKDAPVKTTSTLGVIFAIMGIFASSLYTVWISTFHKKMKLNSMQLLLNQAPLAAFMLLYVIPLADSWPVWKEAPTDQWMLILLSGLCACMINMSQFFIIAQTGPVSSTVVGHVKTCTIVALGWITSGRTATDKSVLGVIIALSGIISYSAIMLPGKATQPKP